LKYPDLKY